jgi:hypothetical protein
MELPREGRQLGDVVETGVVNPETKNTAERQRWNARNLITKPLLVVVPVVLLVLLLVLVIGVRTDGRVLILLRMCTVD